MRVGVTGEMSAAERCSDGGWRQERIDHELSRPIAGMGPKVGLAAGFEGLDYDHAPAAARTSVPLFVFVTAHSGPLAEVLSLRRKDLDALVRPVRPRRACRHRRTRCCAAGETGPPRARPDTDEMPGQISIGDMARNWVGVRLRIEPGVQSKLPPQGWVPTNSAARIAWVADPPSATGGERPRSEVRWTELRPDLVRRDG